MEIISSQKPESYFDRNRRWLSPLLATAMLVTGLLAAQTVVGDIGFALPIWLIKAVLVLGLFTTGLGSAFTNTVSSRLLQGAGICVAIALMLHSIWR